MQMGDATTVCRSYSSFLDGQESVHAYPKIDSTIDPAISQPVSEPISASASDQKNSSSAIPSIESITLLRNNAPLHSGLSPPEVFISRQDDLAVQVQIRQPKVNAGSAQLAILIKDDSNRVVSSLSTLNDGFNVSTLANAKPIEIADLTVTFKALSLLKGRYRIDVILMCDRAIRFIETITDALTFEVTQTDKEIGIVSLPHKWTQR